MIVRKLLIAAMAFALSFSGVSMVASAAETGYLRVIHASPDAPAVDIYLDGAMEPAITDLAFGQATAFIELPAKAYDVAIRPAGAAADSDPVYEAKGIELPAGVSANAIATGLLAGEGDQAFGVNLFVTDRSATEGKARVEVYHASPDAPAVDVLAGGSAVVSGLAFRAGAGPLNLDPGSYDLAVVPAGATEPVVIDLSGAMLDADTIYTVIAIGLLENISPLLLTSTSTDMMTGYLRVIHASPDAPAVDIYLDGAMEPAITDLAFGQATAFIELPAKAYDVAIRPAGAAADSDPVYEAKGIELPAGVSANAIATGLLAGEGDQAFGVNLFVTDRSATEGKARVEVYHASPDAPAVDVLAGGSAVVSGLAFRAGAGPLNLDPGSYDLAVVPAGATEPVVIDLSGAMLDADTIYTVIAIGLLENISPLLLTSTSADMMR